LIEGQVTAGSGSSESFDILSPRRY